MKYRRTRRLLKKKHIVVISTVLFVLVAAVVIIGVSAASKERAREQQAVDTKLHEGLLRIGLRGDIDALCTYNEETGQYEGLEKDIADELVSRIFGDDIIVEYVDVNSRTKDALLKIGDVDLSLGASINTDQSGICYTSSYFADACGFLVMKDESVSQETLEDLSGGVIAMVQGSLPAMESEADEDKTKLDEYLALKGITVTIKEYASYPEAINALGAGFVKGVCAAQNDLKHFGKSGMLLLNEAFMPNRYCVQFVSADELLCAVFSKTIEEMRKDGTIEALAQKWNITDYSGLEDISNE